MRLGIPKKHFGTYPKPWSNCEGAIAGAARGHRSVDLGWETLPQPRRAATSRPRYRRSASVRFIMCIRWTACAAVLYCLRTNTLRIFRLLHGRLSRRRLRKACMAGSEHVSPFLLTNGPTCRQEFSKVATKSLGLAAIATAGVRICLASAVLLERHLSAPIAYSDQSQHKPPRCETTGKNLMNPASVTRTSWTQITVHMRGV